MELEISPRAALIGAGAIAVLALGLYVARKGVAGAAAGITSGAIGAVVDAGAGVVVGLGQVVGIPATNETECEKAKREGRTWDASFACPAADFLTWSVGGLFKSEGAGQPASTGGATGSW